MDENLEALLNENRRFLPDPDFALAANVQSPSIYRKAHQDFEAYWSNEARRLDWFTPFQRTLEWNPPHAKWFLGGTLNAAYNCLDRHVLGERRNKTAILWEGEPGDRRQLTYGQLLDEVGRFANVLKSLGVKKGDRVTIYLPMIVELAVAVLASARIGAIHSVVFGGFSAQSLRDRINDAGSTIVITADGGFRKGNVVPLKANADTAIAGGAHGVRHTVVVKRVGEKAQIDWDQHRDLWWHELMAKAPAACEPEPMDSEDPLFILYTSGTTGKPKGIVHSTAGYLTGVASTSRMVFDLKDRDVFWCTADIGWITGHSYVIYGPLANGATVLMYEGAPDYPDRGRMWELVERYGVNIFYTAPTAIRSHMRWGVEWPKRHDLRSLRLLGTVGEPINPEAWIWYWRHIGGERLPIVDTWWQTETGSIMISPLPGITAEKPGSATMPLPGIDADVVDSQGRPVERGQGGYLVLNNPWPSMLRTIYGDDARYQEQYWSRFPGRYFTGDGARLDEDGYIWILGRVDDVINVSGHRIGTMEVESALVDHQAVAESAVIGRKHEVKGQAIAAFVTLKEEVEPREDLKAELKEHVAQKIGALARPEEIYFAAELPKTRSGKIMRRLLRDIAEGRALGDTTTLADPQVVEELKRQYEGHGE